MASKAVQGTPHVVAARAIGSGHIQHSPSLSRQSGGCCEVLGFVGGDALARVSAAMSMREWTSRVVPCSAAHMIQW
jgi:hypothetical protein